MELVVEDGTGVPGADSYVTIEEANLYHIKMGNTDWESSTDLNRKAAMLRKAAKYLDGTYGNRIAGKSKTPDQGLLFPMVGAFYVDGTEVDPDSVPQVYKDAQCEVALLALQGVSLTTEVTSGPRLKRRKTDVLEKEWFEDSYTSRPVFGWLDTILSPLFMPLGDDQTLQIGRIARA